VWGEVALSGVVDGKRVVSSLLTEEQWSALKRDVRAKRLAITMPCGWPGSAKTSKLGTAYFAHRPGGDGCTAGETAQHLLAKALIVDAIRAAGWDAEPEVRGDGWVADVMATRNGVRVAFEVQWSNQSLDEYRQRQQRYRDAGIASIAWFARHIEHLPPAEKALPVFRLAISDAGEATVHIGSTLLPLSEAVERLLTRRLQHRDHLANGQPAKALVEAAVMDCYRCKKRIGVWCLRGVTVRGRCGQVELRGRSVAMFPEKRPETELEIRAAGEHLAESMGVAPARLARRYTKSSGTHYMAFICPHCRATCGEMFVANEFSGQVSERITEATVPPTAARHPHWCLANDDGVCAVPPTNIITELLAADEAEGAYAGATAVTITPVGGPRNISIGQAVSRMFGGY
jgi:hypothetical protein